MEENSLMNMVLHSDSSVACKIWMVMLESLLSYEKQVFCCRIFLCLDNEGQVRCYLIYMLPFYVSK